MLKNMLKNMLKDWLNKLKFIKDVFRTKSPSKFFIEEHDLVKKYYEWRWDDDEQ